MFAQLVDRDDVGMLQSRRGTRFAGKTRARVRLRTLSYGHDLDRNVAFQVVVSTAKDAAHSPLAHVLDDTVAADDGGRHAADDSAPHGGATLARPRRGSSGIG